ncbi:MAG: tRNA (adenine-N1)-methyltransferase [Chloroflexi bacterium]|nr:tRNA (adenine-N1)-methyltransferase [Chloroflexota bacterium]
MTIAQVGDLVLLISDDRKRFLIRLEHEGEWHTHRGLLRHDELIGQPLGRTVRTQIGHPFLALEPSTHDLIQQLRRITQIIFPKDAAYITMRLNCYPGRRVVEAGTGSGGLTLALARAVMPGGRVYSYEARAKMLNLAHRNLERAGLLDYVELKVRDIAEGFDERDADGCFLDLREPWHYLAQARAALKPGGFFGSILPTTNQVSELLAALNEHDFVEIVVEELLLRAYKPVATRLRPTDRMVAHTGYLVFARAVAPEDANAWRYRDPKHGIPRATADESEAADEAD